MHLPRPLAGLTILALLGCPGESAPTPAVFIATPEDHEAVTRQVVVIADVFGPELSDLTCTAQGQTRRLGDLPDGRFQCGLELTTLGPTDVLVRATYTDGRTASDQHTVLVTDQALPHLAFTPSSLALLVAQGGTVEGQVQVWTSAGLGAGTLSADLGGQTAVSPEFTASFVRGSFFLFVFRAEDDAPPDIYDIVFTGTAGSATATVAASIEVSGGVVYRLRVLPIPGSNPGIVTSTPPGIACDAKDFDSDCEQNYSAGTVVTLQAAPPGTATWTFCDEADGDTCIMTMDEHKVVSVNFREQSTFRLQVSTDGTGGVTSQDGGIACGSTHPTPDCQESYVPGTQVFLTAAPTENFQSWANCPSADGNVCVVPMDQDRAVFAQFTSSPGVASGP